jgi:hypothetical protein
MKNALLTAAMMMLALGAGAEGMPQMLGSDPLSRQILSKTAQENGGVTAAVRVGSGQVISLQLADVTATAPLAVAATNPAAALKTADGLKPKAAKTAKAKKHVKRAVDQLKHMSSAKSWADKR